MGRKSVTSRFWIKAGQLDPPVHDVTILDQRRSVGLVFSWFLVGFHGFSMWFHGFSWFLVGFNSFSRCFHGFWLVSMVFQVSFMVSHCFGLVSMVFQGGFMVFGWFPWFFKVVSWFLVGFHCFSM